MILAKDVDELERVREFITTAANGSSRLPPEREIAEHLGLTRGKLRNSLKRLASDGTIWRHVGKGTYLGQPPEDEKDRIAFPNRVTPREIIRARLSVEPELARLAAYNATLAQIGALFDHITRMKKTDDLPAWGEMDSSLHRAIGSATGNVLLGMMGDLLQAPEQKQVWGRLRINVQTPARREAADAEHEKIVSAISDRDADAAQAAMRMHLLAVNRALFGEA